MGGSDSAGNGGAGGGGGNLQGSVATDRGGGSPTNANSPGAGGGGTGGAGGNGGNDIAANGNGGSDISGSSGGAGSVIAAGTAGAAGGGGGGGLTSGGDGGSRGGGGGGGRTVGGSGGDGGYLGGGGAQADSGGNGGPFGGGGGGFSSGGNGGNFGGGGGAASLQGGAGGFGGGGGGGITVAGLGGYAAGNGGAGQKGGGGGAGLGGAIFIRQGGSLTIGTGCSFSGNSVTGGAAGSSGAGAGQGQGSDLFLGDATSDNIVLTVNSAVTFPGNIATRGGWTKAGSGTMTLTGTSSNIGGNTTVSAGRLSINGTFGSTGTTITVQSGATIGGTGTISLSSTTIQSGGTLAPGNSVGTLTVASLTLDSGSQMQIEIDATGASRTNVTGDATLGSSPNPTVFVIHDATAPNSGSYTILSVTGTLSGTFSSSVTGGLAGVAYTLQQTTGVGGSVILSYVDPFTTTTTSLSGNAKRLNEYLRSIRSLPLLSTTMAQLSTLSSDAFSSALKSISPSRKSLATFASATTTFAFSQALEDRLANLRFLNRVQGQIAKRQQDSLNQKNGDTEVTSASDLLAMADFVEAPPLGPSEKPSNLVRDETRYAVWAEGIGDFAHLKAQSQDPAFHYNSGGALLGFDYSGNSRAAISSALGFTQVNLNDEKDAGKSKIDFYSAGLFATGYLGNGFLEGGLSGVYNHYRIERHISFPGTDTTATSTHGGWQLAPHLAGGYDLDYQWGAVEPFAVLDYTYLWENSFNESGAANGLNFHFPAAQSSMLQSQVGVNFYETVNRQYGVLIFKEGAAYVNRQGFGIGNLHQLALVGAPGNLQTVALTDMQNLFSPNVEVFFFAQPRHLFFSLSYTGMFGSGYISNEIFGKLGVAF